MITLELTVPELYHLRSALHTLISEYESDLRHPSRDDCYTMNARTRKDIHECKQILDRVNTIIVEEAERSKNRWNTEGK